jgi:hypothetical protein
MFRFGSKTGIAGRSTQGVIVFDTAEDEHVVSVENVGDDGGTLRQRRLTAVQTDIRNVANFAWQNSTI